MAEIMIGPIERTSPTLAESMRQCFLRAGLAKSEDANQYVLDHPAAWLGNAYHKVMELIPQADLTSETLEDAISRIWNESISARVNENKNHSLNCRFEDPVRWPKYAMTKANAEVRAEELVGIKPSTRVSSKKSKTREEGLGTETWLEAFGGKLGGKPDFLSKNTIKDYKSGAIYESDDATNNTRLKESYVRQLKIYGHLVEENRGYLPSHGVISPASGKEEEIELKKSECAAEALNTIDLLDSYNAQILGGVSVEDLSSPAAKTCNWCDFKIVCPSFWATCSADWSDELSHAVVSGTLISNPEIVFDGRAVSIVLEPEFGILSSGTVQIGPLPLPTFDHMTNLSSGERVRAVGLRVREDGSVRPSDRTLIMPVEDLPEIQVAASTPTPLIT